MKKFYIVNDYKDLLSGNIIPHKVLNYLPMAPMMQPMIQPMPITKSQGITISPVSPVMHSIMSQQMPSYPFFGPIDNVSVSRTAIFPNSPMYGPPIIKMSPMVSQNVPGTIKIISDSNIFTLNVPFRYIRDVTSYIWLNAQDNLDSTQPKVTFRVITPVLDTSITSTFNRMIEIVKVINNRYSDIVYVAPDGSTNTISALLRVLNNMLNSKKFGSL